MALTDKEIELIRALHREALIDSLEKINRDIGLGESLKVAIKFEAQRLTRLNTDFETALRGGEPGGL